MTIELESADLFDVRVPAYLVSLSDGPGNRLTLVIEEATGLGPPGEAIETPSSPADEAFNEIMANAQAIKPGPSDRVIEMTWEQPVSYAVTDESFADLERDGQTADGRVARIVQNSWFDDFVKASTWADDNFPGQLRHYSIVTNNHCVNVISAKEPKLKLVSVCGPTTG